MGISDLLDCGKIPLGGGFFLFFLGRPALVSMHEHVHHTAAERAEGRKGIVTMTMMVCLA